MTTSTSLDGLAPLFQASRDGDLALLTRLLDQGVDYLEADGQGWTALHWAITQCRLDIVEKLLSHRRATGPSPLPPLYTLTYNDIKTLAAKALPAMTPIELAAEVEDDTIFKVLLEELEPYDQVSIPFNSVWAPCPAVSLENEHLYPGLEISAVAKNTNLPQSQQQQTPTDDCWRELGGFLLNLAVKDGKLGVVEMLLRLGVDHAL
jgi:ankyrin repeat protein